MRVTGADAVCGDDPAVFRERLVFVAVCGKLLQNDMQVAVHKPAYGDTVLESQFALLMIPALNRRIALIEEGVAVLRLHPCDCIVGELVHDLYEQRLLHVGGSKIRDVFARIGG